MPDGFFDPVPGGRRALDLDIGFNFDHLIQWLASQAITLNDAHVSGTLIADPLFRLPVKTTTGNPASPSEGDLYVNTFDNALRLFADAAWRDVVTW